MFRLLRGNYGVLSCLDARTGEVHYEGQKLPGVRSVYASPVGAANRVYVTDRDGTTMVISHEDKPQLLAINQLDEGVNASAAIVGNDLLLRGEKHLYCINSESNSR